MLVTLLIAVLLGLCILGGGVLLSRRRPSRSRRLDGWARIEGACGSTLEIGLGIEDGRVGRSAYRADGCGYNCTCLHAATRLAKGMAPDDLFDIDAQAILRSAGNIPEDHRHCAEMAARTLHAASRNYLEKCEEQGVETVPERCAARDGQDAFSLRREHEENIR